MCYIGRGHLFGGSANLSEDAASIERDIEPEPGILVFAGDQSLPHNTFLGDQWLLTLQDLHYSMSTDTERKVTNGCEELLNQSKTDNNSFDWTCGIMADINSDKPCRTKDLIKMAWCLEQYNSFSSLLL